MGNEEKVVCWPPPCSNLGWGTKKYLKTIWKRSLSTNNTKPSTKGETKVNPTNCKKKTKKGAFWQIFHVRD